MQTISGQEVTFYVKKKKKMSRDHTFTYVVWINITNKDKEKSLINSIAFNLKSVIAKIYSRL